MTKTLSTTKFDWQDLIRRLATLAIPVALQNLLSTTGGMIDTMMIASLGELSVAAVGLCAQFSFLMFSCYWGFVGGGGLFISQYWGAKDEKGICRSYGLTILCLMIVSFTFMILGTCAPRFVLKLYTDKSSIQTIGYEYLKIVAFAYPLQVLSIGMSTLLRSTERVKIPLYASLASVVTNTFLNWVLIFGNLGAPVLGVKGAAIATVFGTVVACVMSIVSLFKKDNFFYI